jgi:hypothetical protein
VERIWGGVAGIGKLAIPVDEIGKRIESGSLCE